MYQNLYGTVPKTLTGIRLRKHLLNPRKYGILTTRDLWDILAKAWILGYTMGATNTICL